jgi:hypothetical protein
MALAVDDWSLASLNVESTGALTSVVASFATAVSATTAAERKLVVISTVIDLCTSYRPVRCEVV